MRRARVLVQIVTWLTIVTLLPVPWADVVGWLPDLQSLGDRLNVAWAEENSIPPSERRGAGARAASSSAFPPENVVLQQAGAVSMAPVEARKPTFDFDESPTRGPGLAARLPRPAEPLLNVELRMRGVGGRQPQKSGRQTRFQVPKDGSGALPLATPPAPPRVGGTATSSPPAVGTAQTVLATPTSAVASATPIVPTAVSSPSAQRAPANDDRGGWLGLLWRLFAPPTAHAQLFGTPFPLATAPAAGPPGPASVGPPTLPASGQATATPSATATATRTGTATGNLIAPLASTPTTTSAVVATQVGTPTTPTATTPTGTPTIPTAPSSGQAGQTTATPTATGTKTPTPAATATATRTPTASTTVMATTTPPASPSPFSSPPVVTSPPASPVIGAGSGNAYGARLELVYEQSADGTSVKETIFLHDRPQSNVLTYDLRIDGLKADPRPDGSLDLVDHLGQPAFRIPAPTFHDATGRAGAASYRLSAGQLDIVLDPALVSNGALPLEVDPTLIFVATPGLESFAQAPWQRQTFAARDGIQALLFYHPPTGNNGLWIKASVDHFKSSNLHQDELLIFGHGSSGFSVEIDPATDTVYVATIYMGASSTSYLRVYALPYNPATRKWSLGPYNDVFWDHEGTMSGPTIAIERDGSGTGYLWIGVDRQATSTIIPPQYRDFRFNYQLFKVAMSAIPGSGAVLATDAPLGRPPWPHYASVIATGEGIMVVGRTEEAAGKGMAWAVRSSSGTWGALAKVEPVLANHGPEAWGKYYAWVTVANPANPASRTTLLAYAPQHYDPDFEPTSTRVYYRTDGASAWSNLNVTVVPEFGIPQLSWDGTSFYLVRTYASDPNSTVWEVYGRRGVIKLDGTAQWEWSADRVMVNEGDPNNKNIKWLEVPRRISAEMLPIFYLRDRPGTDDIAVQVERIQMIGDRPGWEYREIVMPGAGVMKVNLANGNLHYRMTDTLFPARQWNDEITRTYDSWATDPDQGFHLLGPGWSASFQPRLEIAADQSRVNYWASDGARYAYAQFGSNWYPEFGMYAELTRPNSASDKVWKLKDVFGNVLYFDGAGRPTRKEDSKTTPSTWVWANNNPGQRPSVLTGSTGRTQAFTLDAANHVTKIRVTSTGGSYFDYDYTYANNRLESATLATNTEFVGSNPATRVRVTYGYDSDGRLNQVTTPEGSVYVVHYDGYGRVDWVDLPDPATGATSNCGKPGGRHCWEFAYASGLGETRVTDPSDPYAPTDVNAKPWVTKAHGSGQVYWMKDPLGHEASRTWTVFGNLNSETDQLGKVTRYFYDEKGNRTRIEDPVNGAAKPTTFSYDDKSRRISRTDPRGNTTTYAYNTDGLLWKETDPEGGVVEFTYDTNGNLTRTKNPRGHETVLTYDGHGQVESETTPDGAKVATTRDVWGRTIEKRVGRATGWQADDRITRTAYDGLSRVTSTKVRMGANPTVDDPADLVSAITYDRDGHVRSRTNPRGYTTNVTVDRRGRVTGVEGPPTSGGTGGWDRPCVATAYDQRGLVVGVRTALVRTTGQPCAWDAGGTTWGSTVERAYDLRGLLTTERLANLNAGEYAGGKIERGWTYDAAGRVVTATDPDGRYEAYTYDALGRKLSAESAVTLFGVTGTNCHNVSTAVCSKAEWEYDPVGNVTKEKIPTGGQTLGTVQRTYAYDKIQRLTTRTDELGRIWTYEYDANGNRIKEAAPLNRITTWAYDVGDRPVSVTDPLNHTSTTAYDVWDNVTSATNALNQTTAYAYDKANRLVQVIDPLSQTASLQYDKNGNRTALVDPRGNVQTVSYDPADRPITFQTPPASAGACTPLCSSDVAVRTATTNYDLDGLVKSASDFNDGSQRTYTYDSARRLKVVNYPGTALDVVYGYDKLGRRTSLAEGGTTTATYGYDEWGRLTAETRGASVVRYRYDRRHQTQTVYPDGKALTSTYDTAGQLLHLDDWRGSGTGRTSFSYDGAGRRTGRTLPNGVATTWAYDPADRLTLVEHRQTAGGTVLFSAASTYDAVGRRLSQVDYDPARATGGGFGLPTGLPTLRGGPSLGPPAGLPAPRGGPSVGPPGGLPAGRSTILPAITTQTFQYDAAGRLTQEARDGFGTTSWTYDPAGNRLTETSGGVTTSYAYDADNRLTSKTTSGQTTTYTYDKNGSLLQSQRPGQTMVYGWDDAGRLASVSKDFNPATTFAYDGDGVRTSKTSGGQTTSYVNDARGLAQVLQETKGTNTVSYVPGVGQYDPSKPAGAPQWGYTLADSQNSRLLVDGAGTLGHRWEWKPFGETRADVGSTSSPFTFGGEQKDDETGLINLRARYYDPALGRFLSRDSLPGVMTLPQSWNRYSYVENDPINHLDPSGHKKKKIKWPGGQDPDDDSHQKKKAKKCKNPGQYTGSCKGGPPNAAYAADGEAQHEAKKAGQAAAAGNLAAAAAHLQAAAHFASIAGTSAANTAMLHAYASIIAAVHSIQAAHHVDNSNGSQAFSAPALSVCAGHPAWVFTCHALIHAGAHTALELLLQNPELPSPPPKELMFDQDGLPILFIDSARMPNIAMNAYDAQRIEPALAVLTYLAPDDPKREENYRAACGDSTGPPLTECEEYPFRVTAEGGRKEYTRRVPAIEQRRQGGVSRVFYNVRAKLQAGDRFRVIVWFAPGFVEP